MTAGADTVRHTAGGVNRWLHRQTLRSGIEIGNRMKICTAVFDMGNVLVRFSHERMCGQIGQLCGRTAGEIAVLLFESGLQWDFERGHCTEPQMQARLEAAVGTSLPADDLRHAAANIFEPIDGMRQILHSVKAAGIRLVLLSNTSITHYEFIRGQWDILQPFDAQVLSYEVGAIKPEPAIFEAVLRAIDCDPADAFYTDDIPAYVEAGRSYGLQAEVFTSPAQLRAQLNARGLSLPETP